jgi:hypothetical protein
MTIPCHCCLKKQQGEDRPARPSLAAWPIPAHCPQQTPVGATTPCTGPATARSPTCLAAVDAIDVPTPPCYHRLSTGRSCRRFHPRSDQRAPVVSGHDYGSDRPVVPLRLLRLLPPAPSLATDQHAPEEGRTTDRLTGTSPGPSGPNPNRLERPAHCVPPKGLTRKVTPATGRVCDLSSFRLGAFKTICMIAFNSAGISIRMAGESQARAAKTALALAPRPCFSEKKMRNTPRTAVFFSRDGLGETSFSSIKHHLTLRQWSSTLAAPDGGQEALRS